MTAASRPGTGERPPDRVRAGPVRRGPAQLPFAAVVAGLAAGLVTVELHHFRAGCLGLGAALVLAALFRLLLPAGRAGLLVVRGRLLDVGVLAVLGAAVLALAAVVPAG